MFIKRYSISLTKIIALSKNIQTVYTPQKYYYSEITPFCFFFLFSVWVFFHMTFTIHRTAGEKLHNAAMHCKLRVLICLYKPREVPNRKLRESLCYGKHNFIKFQSFKSMLMLYELTSVRCKNFMASFL